MFECLSSRDPSGWRIDKDPFQKVTQSMVQLVHLPYFFTFDLRKVVILSLIVIRIHLKDAIERRRPQQIHDLQKQLSMVSSLEWQCEGGQFDQYASKGPHIRTEGIVIRTEEQLGCSVTERTSLPRDCFTKGQLLGRAEVPNHYSVLLFRDENITGFEVPMYYMHPMEFFQPCQYLKGIISGHILRNPLPFHPYMMVQIGMEKLTNHTQKPPPIFQRVIMIDQHQDITMVKLPQYCNLPTLGPGILWDFLKSRCLIGLREVCLVDETVRAFVDGFVQSVFLLSLGLWHMIGSIGGQLHL